MWSLYTPNFKKSVSLFRRITKNLKKKIRALTKKISKVSSSWQKIIGSYAWIIYKNTSSRMIRLLTYYTIFLVLVVWIVQPQLLQFHIWEWRDPIVASVVFAQQIAGEQQDWSLQFEKLLTDTWEDNRLVYTVQPGESVWSIAKQFATSTKELLNANDLDDVNLLRPGQKIIISYAKNQLIYEVEEWSTLQDFSRTYDLDINELMNLNFISDVSHELQVGDQILLDISVPEAQRKNLYQKPIYETPEELLDPIVEEALVEDSIDVLNNQVNAYELKDGDEFSQKIISAEETTNSFDTQEQRLIQEIKNREIAAAQALLDEQKAKERLEKSLSRRENNASSQTPDPAIRTDAPVQQRVIEARSEITQCWSNKCSYKWKCRILPANAVCSEWWSEAWTCNAWFKEYSSQCISNTAYERKKEIERQKTITKPAKHWIVSQRYFNPSADWYNNGWAWGHCTHGAGRRWWKNYGIMTNWRGNWGKRYYNASAAWRQVWQTPEVWAIFSTKWAAENGWYGHVWIVTQVDWSSWSMMVVDMNYVWKATFSQRWVPIKMPWLIWFIYPRKK